MKNELLAYIATLTPEQVEKLLANLERLKAIIAEPVKT